MKMRVLASIVTVLTALAIGASGISIRRAHQPTGAHSHTVHETAFKDRLVEQDGFGSDYTAGLPLIDAAVRHPVLETRALVHSSATLDAETNETFCPSSNGTLYTSDDGHDYTIICDVNFPNHDLPFAKTDNFTACLAKCDEWNAFSGNKPCLAVLFVASRLHGANDCYLKYYLAPTVNASGIVGGILTNATGTPHAFSVLTKTAGSLDTCKTDEGGSATHDTALVSQIKDGQVQAAVPGREGAELQAEKDSGDDNASPAKTIATIFESSSKTITSSSTETISSSASTSPGSASEAASTTSTTSTKVSFVPVTYASGDSVIAPDIKGSRLHGPSVNKPSDKYVDVDTGKVITLPKELLNPAINVDLTTQYPVSPQTGVIPVNESTKRYVKDMASLPTLSRDGGQGGMISGHYVFIFCDTGSYQGTTAETPGKFLGFVSSSVAVDVGMNGLKGEPLFLQDGIGQWSDDVGRERGFAPLTEGEVSYNIVMQGQGQRFALWPESAIIPLTAQSGLLYTPIIFDNVNRATGATSFTYTGAALLTITADDEAGPIATRTVVKIFEEDEVSWGCSGGIRSWGPSGVGGDDGNVYLFGNIADQGLLLARTPADKVAIKESLTYWTGTGWTSQMPGKDSTAFVAKGQFKDIHVLYSPRHLTFILIYLNSFADNTFYYRYLLSDHAVLPSFAPGADGKSDYVELITEYTWSDEKILYKAGRSLSGRYIYAGSVHEGYYGTDDLTNGGTKLLISWTAPTGQDPGSENSEYQIVTAEVHFA